MVTLAPILELPLDDDEAFLAFEEDAYQAFQQSIRNADEQESWSPYWLTYMTHMTEAAAEFGVASLAEVEVRPPINSEEFDRFRHEVLAATTKLKFRVARRMRQELIEPDTSDREKLKFRVRQLRDEIDASALPQTRKDALNAKLDELEREFEGKAVNRAQVLVILTACATLLTQAQGMVLKGPETIVAVLDTIGMVIGKEQERRALLERYRKPLAIEHKPMSSAKPKAGYGADEFTATLDDQIPF